ncbi:hypothetical protein POPTR_001G432820v4 [Populus trichocarpa]|uniref:Uncharacterized protein n=1 Tax=Populus trichocarpa TaxID=3694 RepID=A0ACC0TPH4_POPTR|nr:hypothetical protein POPTR_001G432820v4 [Populus trichocarpa]
MKKKYKPSGSPPPITFPFNNPSRPFICFPFHTAAPSPPTLSIFIHTSQTQPPPSITPTPINSRSLPLTAASSSPVNELRLFSDNHSSNLERNRRACEVAKLLPLLDLLQSIASIKADYIAQVDERTQFGKEIGIVVPVSDSQKTINRKQLSTKS